MDSVTSTAEWLWDRLPLIAGIFAIPWGLFFVSLVLAGWDKVRHTSASDIYVILCSFDLEFLIFRDQFINAVYGGLKSNFESVFGVGLVISLFFLAWSSRVQRQINEHLDGRGVTYPAAKSLSCWAFALGWMACHFAVVLIR